MASSARRPAEPQNRFLRPLVPIVIVLVAAIVFLFIGSAIASARSADAATLDAGRALPYLVVGAIVMYGIAVFAGDRDLWQITTREVVYMAIGAALYGVLSWATNIIQLPSISLISFRPAVVIPIFFGVVFGPAVGFFAGFVGNVLGDALTGWGVFPIWDIGNGLIGLVAGLAVAFARDRKLPMVLLTVVGAVGIIATLLFIVNPVITDPNDSTATVNVGSLWWAPLLSVLALAAVYFVSRNNSERFSAQMWGALGVVVGIGFSALADIWWNGYSLTTAVLGEFVPAAAANMVISLILLPILLTAWRSAQAQTGR